MSSRGSLSLIDLAGSENIETMMQLVYLFFTNPNHSRIAFEDWKRQTSKDYIHFSGKIYTRDFYNTLRSITGDMSLPTTFNRKGTPGGTEGFHSIKKTDFDKAFNIYKSFFGDARDFTFIITGDFEIEQILPLAQKYLGNLSASNSRGTKNQARPELGEGPSLQILPNEGNYRMDNFSYGTIFIQQAKDAYDWQEHLRVEALGEVVRQKLWDLRFKKGYGIYSVSGRGQYNADLRRYEVETYLYCQPQDFPKLQKEIERIFSEIKEGIISPSELKPALDLVHYFNFSERAHLVGARIQKLYEHYRFNQPFVEQVKAEEYTRNLTIPDIVEVAREYLKKENFHELVIREK